MRAEQLIRTEEELDAIEAQVLNAASRTVEALKRLLGEKQPLRAFAEMKFQMAGFHPTADRPLNLIEQINQTFTYLASLRATRWLLQRHPASAPFRLNLGTAGGTDVESVDGSIAAETFAAVNPRNNSKLDLDIQKVSRTSAAHKYVSYICATHPMSEPQPSSKRDGVKVVSLGW